MLQKIEDKKKIAAAQNNFALLCRRLSVRLTAIDLWQEIPNKF